MFTLAAVGSYIFPWQFPLIGVFLVCWLVGGGYLFHKTLSKKVQTRRGVPLGQGILISLLSGMGGAMAGGVLYGVGHFASPPSALSEGGMPFSYLGVGLAILGYLVVAWLVVFAMQKLPARDVLNASVLPIVATVAAAIVIGLACLIPAVSVRRTVLGQERLMRENTQHLSELYHWIYRQSVNEPVASLAALKSFQGFDENLLKNPAAPKMEIGYFYHPSPMTPPGADEQKRLLACDFKGMYETEDSRMVLYTNGEIAKLIERAFQMTLEEEQNREFAEALRKAEGQ